MAIVTLDNVTKRRGETVALDGISVEFADQTVTAILGASGSGKTTLLHLINGLLRPDAGHVRVFSEAIDYTDLPALRRQIGYAVQSVGLFPHLTVHDNLTLAGQLFGLSGQTLNSRATRLMTLMQLDRELATRFPHQLSGGQRQRIGICRAMMLEPKVLLLDEPFSGVDPIARRAIHGEFLSLLEEEPTTTIVVTHDVAEAKRLANRIVVIDQGTVLQSGAFADVESKPANEIVGELMAAGRDQ